VSHNRAVVPAGVPAEQIRAAVRTGWHRSVEECVAVAGSTWAVVTQGERFAATLVPAGDRARFEAGLAAAGHLDARGFAAGAPERAAHGQLTTGFGGCLLALLRWVPGRPLEPADPVDQQWWGDTLAAAHRALAGFGHPGLARFPWVRPEAAHLGFAPWIRPVVAGAVAAVARLSVTDQLTYGVLHGDPLARSFRLDVFTGRLGLVGWAAAAHGPLVYDVAAAVLHAGGPAEAVELLDGYRAAGPVPKDELDAALPVMLRLRLAVRVDEFARRLFRGDGADLDELARTRDQLARLAVDGPGGL
jgi:homoserine kinase type II